MKDEIEKLIKLNPKWESFVKEYDGGFVLEYDYHGIHFVLYNQVGGVIFITTSWDTVDLAKANIDTFNIFSSVARELFLKSQK